MMMKMVLAGISLALSCGMAQAAGNADLVREEKKLIVDGHEEVWQLRWLIAPKPSPECSPLGKEFESTCMCSGFAYGESGKLEVVRRVGTKTEHLVLDQFAGVGGYDTQGPDTVLRKWDPQPGDPFDKSDRNALAKLIASLKDRPKSEVLALGDYLHDGVGRQFTFQVGQLTCGKRMSILVGVTAQNPHLHVIKADASAKEPQVAEQAAWQAMLSGNGSGAATLWPCGDHGSEQETEVLLRAQGGFVKGSTRNYACTGGDTRGPLVETGSWPQ